ncbi:MAG: response regulator [Candidatus Obscuribacterales bacterium]|nr:response regulator [Candidatus Obscuribacterales bacterium]
MSADIRDVLLVDDDANLRLIVQMSLEGLTDWNVRVAARGEEALLLAAERTPDLVLLDIMMPDLDGITVFTELRRLHPTLPVIFITAKVQTQEIRHYKNLGAAGVIIKPFDPMKVVDEIRKILT